MSYQSDQYEEVDSDKLIAPVVTLKSPAGSNITASVHALMVL